MCLLHHYCIKKKLKSKEDINMVSKIDKLVKYHANLKLKKQQVEDRINQKNSANNSKI